jgi:exosortase/archaeosortase family protein
MSITRGEYFAALYFIGCANGLLGRFLLSAKLEGWTGALLAFDINVIVLFACWAGISLILSDKQGRVSAADLVVGAAFLALVALPIGPVSWVAVSGLSLYILLFANSSSEWKRGAIILFTLTVPMLWSRLIFQLFAKVILDIDAAFVSALLGTQRVGNMVRFADESGFMVISPACTSFANISIAFLCWVSLSQWAGRRWTPFDLVWCLLACSAAITVNVVRIVVTGLSYQHYETIHNQFGEMVGGFIILVLIVGICLIGVRREVFSRT